VKGRGRKERKVVNNFNWKNAPDFTSPLKETYHNPTPPRRRSILLLELGFYWCPLSIGESLLDPGFFFCSGLLLASHATQRNNPLGLIAPDGGVYSNYMNFAKVGEVAI
jgi:hypothetical protein